MTKSVRELELELAKARQVEFDNQRAVRAAKERSRGSWLAKQLAVVREGAPIVAKVIKVKCAYGADGIGRTIKWDIFCDTQPKRTRLGEVSRRKADMYARELRIMGHSVRVIQS